MKTVQKGLDTAHRHGGLPQCRQAHDRVVDGHLQKQQGQHEARRHVDVEADVQIGQEGGRTDQQQKCNRRHVADALLPRLDLAQLPCRLAQGPEDVVLDEIGCPDPIELQLLLPVRQVFGEPEKVVV